MRFILLLIFCKTVSYISKRLGLGSGSTWPGEILLRFYPAILSWYFQRVKNTVILVAGTNGKTTTAKMIASMLRGSIVHNESGANLENGLVSACIHKTTWFGRFNVDFAVFEVDENTVPSVTSNITNNKTTNTKHIIVLLNLFRDQLDRYGEVDAIARKWKSAIGMLDKDARVILNADDPQIAVLGESTSAQTFYFGLEKEDAFLESPEHATDSIFCPKCGKKLLYKGTYLSHLGIWKCGACAYHRPRVHLSSWDYPLPGLYNEYNTLASVLAGKAAGMNEQEIKTALTMFRPAFGRQEELEYSGVKVKLFLSKNPAGFNASLRTVLSFQPSILLLVLNDRIPDGKDVSWIWDVDFEVIPNTVSIIVSGDRVYDMALRMKYARESQKSKVKNPHFAKASRGKQNHNFRLRASFAEDASKAEQGFDGHAKLKIYEDLKQAIDKGVSELKKGETLYVLATYSAMLEVRKIVKGRKIL